MDLLKPAPYRPLTRVDRLHEDSFNFPDKLRYGYAGLQDRTPNPYPRSRSAVTGSSKQTSGPTPIHGPPRSPLPTRSTIRNVDVPSYVPSTFDKYDRWGAGRTPARSPAPRSTFRPLDDPSYNPGYTADKYDRWGYGRTPVSAPRSPASKSTYDPSYASGYTADRYDRMDIGRTPMRETRSPAPKSTLRYLDDPSLLHGYTTDKYDAWGRTQATGTRSPHPSRPTRGLGVQTGYPTSTAEETSTQAMRASPSWKMDADEVDMQAALLASCCDTILAENEKRANPRYAPASVSAQMEDSPADLRQALSALGKSDPHLFREILWTAGSTLKFQYLQACLHDEEDDDPDVTVAKNKTGKRQELWKRLSDRDRRDLLGSSSPDLDPSVRDRFFLRIAEEDRQMREKLSGSARYDAHAGLDLTRSLDKAASTVAQDALRVPMQTTAPTLLDRIAKSIILMNFDPSELISAFDNDNDQRLTFAEVTNLCQSIDENCQFKELSAFFRTMDPDRRGFVRADELLAALQACDSRVGSYGDEPNAKSSGVHQPAASAEGMTGETKAIPSEVASSVVGRIARSIVRTGTLPKDVFEKIDEDKNGTMDRGELDKLIRAFEPDLSPPEVDEVFRCFDKDNNLKIDIHEFCAALGEALFQPPEVPARRSIKKMLSEDSDYTGDIQVAQLSTGCKGEEARTAGASEATEGTGKSAPSNGPAQGLVSGRSLTAAQDFRAIRFLPKSIAGTRHLEEAGANSWRVVDDSGQQRGLTYRNSKNIEDKDPYHVAHFDSVVTGIAEGTWIRVEVSKETDVDVKAAKAEFLQVRTRPLPDIHDPDVQMKILLGNEYTEIIPHLFLAGEYNPQKVAYINGTIESTAPNFGLVVRCSEKPSECAKANGVPLFVFEPKEDAQGQRWVGIHCFNLADRNDLLTLKDCCIQIKAMLEQLCNVLVHCEQGVDLSATVIAAFCMAFFDISTSDARDCLKILRPACTEQAPGYEKLLQANEDRIRRFFALDEDEQMQHGFVCNECGANPIIGKRYKSLHRDYDLCASCFRGNGRTLRKPNNWIEISSDGKIGSIEAANARDPTANAADVGRRRSSLLKPSVLWQLPPSRRRIAEGRKRLKEILSEQGFQEHLVLGDGNCQFRALAHQMYASEARHVTVRQQVVQQLRAAADRYSGFVPGKFEHYVAGMSRLSTWGDHVSLQAAADAFRVQIQVFTDFPTDPIRVVEPAADPQPGVLSLSYHSDVHYNSTRRCV